MDGRDLKLTYIYYAKYSIASGKVKLPRGIRRVEKKYKIKYRIILYLNAESIQMSIF